jgi:hypothetical protein
MVDLLQQSLTGPINIGIMKMPDAVPRAYTTAHTNKAVK